MNETLKVTGRILQISDATRNRNPELFGLAGLRPAVDAEQAPALVSHTPRKQKGARCLGVGRAVLRVSLVAYRSRRLDSDNLIAGLKATRDAIARWFGLDDADKYIEWEYGQHWTNSKEGVAVRIDIL